MTTTTDLDRLRVDDAAWDDFVESSATAFPLQMTAWAEAKAPTGWVSTRVVADGGSGPIGAQMLMRSLGPGPYAMGYLPRGPVATDFDSSSLTAFTAELRRIHETYGVIASQRRAAADIADVARAATFGLVDTVLVDIDEVVPGRVDEETGAITIDETDDAVNYGVVDEIARRVWLNGGKVLAVRRDDIPGNGSVAAILRYAP